VCRRFLRAGVPLLMLITLLSVPAPATRPQAVTGAGEEPQP
jgi:hypothetical protein